VRTWCSSTGFCRSADQSVHANVSREYTASILSPEEVNSTFLRNAVNHRQVRMTPRPSSTASTIFIMSDKFVAMIEEAVVTYLKALSYHLFTGTEERHEILLLVLRRRLEPATFRLRQSSVTKTATFDKAHKVR
jgi:hypothetical protein